MEREAVPGQLRGDPVGHRVLAHVAGLPVAHAQKQRAHPSPVVPAEGGADVRGAARVGGHRAGEGDRVPDHQVGPPLAAEGDQVVVHRLIGDQVQRQRRGERGHAVAHVLVGEHLRALLGDVEAGAEDVLLGSHARQPLGHVGRLPYRQGGQTGPGDLLHDVRLGGDDHLVPGGPQRPRDRDHEEQVRGRGVQGEQDTHRFSSGWLVGTTGQAAFRDRFSNSLWFSAAAFHRAGSGTALEYSARESSVRRFPRRIN